MNRISGLIRIAITIIATVIITPVVGEFFIGLARESHLYDMPARWPGLRWGGFKK
jgi:hypothetical protein